MKKKSFLKPYYVYGMFNTLKHVYFFQVILKINGMYNLMLCSDIVGEVQYIYLYTVISL